MIVEHKKVGTDYPSLSPGQRYLVIGIEADDYRILNDRGEPCLYPAEAFDVVDATEPDEWVHERGEDGERYAYPLALNAAGFFEDFFDRKEDAVQVFWQVINRGLTAA
ncbi:MAG: hypothetical protein ACPGYV_13005 [Phycisphaeraceae bacterium]